MPPFIFKIVEPAPYTASTNKKRQPTKSVYPLVYTQQLQDLDNWDHLFYVQVLNRMSVHEFDEPPKRVLELGCGTGIWVIDAAKRWTKSTFVGIDLQRIQPNLTRCGFTDLASRVKWVHGNFLDPLPFPTESFEFVRIHSVGLGVPEDKWQGLLEEIKRVLAPGGQLELTEEDQIFPCGPNPRGNQSGSSLSIPAETSDNQNYKLLVTTSRTPNTSSEAISPLSSISDTFPFDKPNSSDSDPNFYNTSSRQSYDYEVNPRDHQRIAASWKSMLETRFIAANPLSVLSLYLSAVFERVLPLPQMQIRLPPNSGVAEPETEEDSSGSSSMNSIPDSAVSFKTQPMPPAAPSAWDDPTNFIPKKPIPNSSGAIHLARRLHTIAACKESIWAEYKALYSDTPTVSKIKGRDGKTNNGNTARDEFEFHWSNWVDDMTDRIGMRSVTASTLAWQIPPTSDPLASAVWRGRCGVIDPYEDEDAMECSDETMCRSLRAFLAWKT